MCVCMYVFMYVCMYVGSCIATKVFIGNLPTIGRGGSSPVMNGGQLPINQLHDINWGALDHASRAPQLMSCNYYLYICMKNVPHPQ